MNNIKITANTTVKEITNQLLENIELNNTPELRLTLVVDYSEDVAFIIRDVKGKETHLVNLDSNNYCDINENYSFSVHDPKVAATLATIQTMSEQQKEVLRQALR